MRAQRGNLKWTGREIASSFHSSQGPPHLTSGNAHPHKVGAGRRGGGLSPAIGSHTYARSEIQEFGRPLFERTGLTEPLLQEFFQYAGQWCRVLKIWPPTPFYNCFWGLGSGGWGVFKNASSPGNLIRWKAHWHHSNPEFGGISGDRINHNSWNSPGMASSCPSGLTATKVTVAVTK